jgi:thymidylate kinase
MEDLARQVTIYDAVLLEGCDGAGKTTMASHLAIAHDFQLVHAMRTPDGADLMERYRAILSRPGKLVLDRSFVSELVYGPLFHGGSRLSDDDARELATLVCDRHGVFVHLTGSPARIIARLRLRDGYSPPVEQISKILDGYTRVFEFITKVAPVITVDTVLWSD